MLSQRMTYAVAYSPQVDQRALGRNVEAGVYIDVQVFVPDGQQL